MGTRRSRKPFNYAEADSDIIEDSDVSPTPKGGKRRGFSGSPTRDIELDANYEPNKRTRQLAFESPDEIEVVRRSDGIFAFAQRGVNNAQEGLEEVLDIENGDNVSSEPEIDTDQSDEEDQSEETSEGDIEHAMPHKGGAVCRRSRRKAAAAPVNYCLPASSDDNAEDEPTRDDSSASEDNSESEYTARPGASRRPRAAAEKPTRPPRASSLAAAGTSYNQDVLMRQYYDSEAENRVPRSRKGARGRLVIEDSPDDASGSDDSVALNSEEIDLANSDSGQEDGENDDGFEGAIIEDDEVENEDELASLTEKVLALGNKPSCLSPAARRASLQGHPSPQTHPGKLRVKLTGRSYRAAVWLSKEALVRAGRAQLVRNFERKAAQGDLDPYGDLVDGVHPDWLVIDRIAAHKGESERPRSYLVKWRGLGYSESTWERAKALDRAADRAAVDRYHRNLADAAARVDKASTNKVDIPDRVDPNALPTFCNGRTLRGYQTTSLAWMVSHWAVRQNCILGDEMGLGKTAQSIAVLAYQRQYGGADGPFLVIAPLTTLGHWQREIETWTEMDCIVYSGSAADRELAVKHDLYIQNSRRGRQPRLVKPHVVLSSYETVLRDASLFQSISWETVIIDEAHRMKSTGSSTRTVISQLDVEWLLLLTGTPVQNNMRELFGLLNLLDPIKYSSEEAFLEKFGDEKTCTPKQVQALQATLKPILLRRMKEDVETLPEKEECIIWTQLTVEQRAYYKAIFEGQIATLMAGASSKNMPNLRNLAMELRKVCCHPFLCDGLEEDFIARRAAAGLTGDAIASLVAASGKMVLLHKLLPKLRAEGHKVLIFSQFKIMLDVLEDYLHAVDLPCERIDGSTAGRDRQAAIDRFSKEDSNSFVFLLSTRAGGQGITLTAADTVILYDSDWNPQNDLQAMARCHRIGQDKDVTIYRLVSKDTYEEHVFKTSSRKYGLDEAILGGLGSGGSNGNSDAELDGKKIAQLLRHGAHCLDKIEEANAETEAFASEDIDQILKGRTEKRQIGGRAGTTFSVATFEVGGERLADGAKINDKTFWSTLLPEAAAKAKEEKAAGQIILAPRQKKRINYAEQVNKRRRQSSDSDADWVDDNSDGTGQKGASQVAKAAAKKPALVKEKQNEPKRWTTGDFSAFFDGLLRVGFTRCMDVAKELGLEGKGYPREDIYAVANAMKSVLDAATMAAPSIPCAPNFALLKQGKIQQVMQERKAAQVALNATTTAGEASTMTGTTIDAEMMKEATARAHATLEEQKKEWAAALAKAAQALVLPTVQLPATAEKLLRDPKFGSRLITNSQKYKTHLEQVASLAAWAIEGSPLPVSRGRGLPFWWGKTEDAALLRGCYTLGWDAGRKQAADIEAILAHPSFGFATKLIPAAPVMDLQASKADVGDSFQVRPASETLQGTTDTQEATQEGTMAPPKATHTQQQSILGSTPRAYGPPEWAKLKEVLIKHVRSMLVALCSVYKAKPVGADPSGVVHGPADHGGGGGRPNADDDDNNDDKDAQDHAPLVRMDSGFEIESSGVSAGAVASEPSAEGSVGPASSLPRGGSQQLKGNSHSLFKAVIHAEAKKAAQNSVPPVQERQEERQPLREVPLENQKTEGTDAWDSDPIECFSDSDDDRPVVQGSKLAMAGAEKIAPCAMTGKGVTLDTPGTTVPALCVFEETRGGFTDPLASGVGTAGKKKDTSVTPAGGGSPGAEAPAGQQGRQKTPKKGRQFSLLEMTKVQQYWRKPGEAAAAAEDEVVNLVD